MSDRRATTTVPDWASFFDGPQYAAFVEAVASELQTRSGEIHFEEGVAHVRTEDAREHAFVLRDLAQICNQSEPEEWADIIRNHFDGMERTTSGDQLAGLGEDFERACRLLKVRLYPYDGVRDNLDGLHHRVVAEGLVAVLAYDLPDAVATVPRDDLDQWPIDAHEAFEIGMRNVLTDDDVEHQVVPLEAGGFFSAMVGESFFVTSRLLALETFIAPTSAHGALVSVPNRHTLLWAPIVDLGVLEALNSLLVITHERHAVGPGSLSPYVYWWRPGGRLVTLPAEIHDDKLQFTPPADFLEECLEYLREPNDNGFGPN